MVLGVSLSQKILCLTKEFPVLQVMRVGTALFVKFLDIRFPCTRGGLLLWNKHTELAAVSVPSLYQLIQFLITVFGVFRAHRFLGQVR